MNDKEIAEMLTYDAFGEAENVTGRDYKEDSDTSHVAMALFLTHNKGKAAALRAMGDTTFRSTLEEYLEIALTEGFEIANKVDFVNDRGIANSQYLMWHPDGLLLVFDTYGYSDGSKTSINGGSFSYCYAVRDWESTPGGVMSSHDGLADGVVMGNHDAREALRFNLRRLRQYGEFVKPWPRKGFLMHILHHGDTWPGKDTKEGDRLKGYRRAQHDAFRERLGHRPDILEAMGYAQWGDEW